MEIVKSKYFSEDSKGSWKRCMICGKIPAEIWHNSRNLLTIWHCKNCNENDYNPKNCFQKVLLKIDNKTK